MSLQSSEPRASPWSSCCKRARDDNRGDKRDYNGEQESRERERTRRLIHLAPAARQPRASQPLLRTRRCRHPQELSGLYMTLHTYRRMWSYTSPIMHTTSIHLSCIHSDPECKRLVLVFTPRLLFIRRVFRFVLEPDLEVDLRFCQLHRPYRER